MSALKEFSLALQSYGQAFKLLFHPKVRNFLIIPILLNILLLWLGYSLLDDLSNHLLDLLFQNIAIEEWDFWGSEYMGSVFSVLIHAIFKILFFLFMIFYGGFIIIILMSPFFSIISERIEKIETNKEYPMDIKKLLRDIWRGVRLSLRNSFLQIGLSICALLVGSIPVIGLISPILLFISTAFFYGFSFLDFTIERRYASIRESVFFIRKHRVAAFTNGAVFALSLLLPLCNLFLAAFVAIWAVAAGTITIIKIEQQEKLNQVS